MGLFKTIICPKCGREYSAFRSGCPQCGARKQTPTNRTAATTDSARRAYAAERAAQRARLQLILGLCLVAAVIVAVIVLIVSTVDGNYDTYPMPTPSVEISPTPSSSPTPSPTPTVESVTITFLGEERTEFVVGIGNTVQLEASIYPVEIEGPLEWESSDETVVTVSDTGLVKGVGSGNASIICRCYGAAVECKVYVS